MLKKSTNYINLLSLFLIAYLALIPLKPHGIKDDDIVAKNFYIENALTHVQKITQAPHYVGSNDHISVKFYIIKQLRKMGLKVKIQKTRILTQNKTYTQVENILAKIKGSDENAKALVLMAHYDSVAFASHGAADDASGVAVVLEGVRAWFRKNTKPKNDIIILITDAEELGLLGAKAFVKKHAWAKNIGAVLNFEARGTAGSSIMLMETTKGNHKMLDFIKKANLKFPTSNSIANSIYKLMPNDTDLSAFSELPEIAGFNFAFIDNHYNYHTQLDNYENLSRDSLAHQAYYLSPLLEKLSQADLSQLSSNQDDVYVNIPLWKIISYPFEWALPLSLINLFLLLAVITLGVRNKTIKLTNVISAGKPLFKTLLIGSMATFLVLKYLYWIHPHYNEILQGFVYNGHGYIVFFSLVTVFICLFFYNNYKHSHNISELMIPPLLIWVLISFILAIFLTGAHYLILISFTGTLLLMIHIITNKTMPSLIILLFLPVLYVLMPLFTQLPVALGLMVLPFSGILLALLFSVIVSAVQIPKFYSIDNRLMALVLLVVFIYVETQSSFNQARPLPNSLYYFQDEQSQKAYWFTHDSKTDSWNQDYFNKNKLNPQETQNFKDTHWSWAKIVAKAKNMHISTAKTELLMKRRYSDKQIYRFKITPQRSVSRINLISKNAIDVISLKINKELIDSEPFSLKENRTLARVYTAHESTFTVDVEIAPDQKLELKIIEISPNLLAQKQFPIKERPKAFIPKPFVYSDSIITKIALLL